MQRDTYAFNFCRQKYSKSGTLAASLFPCWPLNINTNMPIIAVVTGDQMHLSYNPNLGPFSLEYTVYSLYILSFDRSIASSFSIECDLVLPLANYVTQNNLFFELTSYVFSWPV